MPNLPISQLPAAGSLTGTELFAVVQNSTTKQTTLNDVSTFGTGSFMITGSISGPVITFTKGDGSTFNLNLTPGGGFPLNYGLFNQTGSSAPISGSTHISGSLIGGGVGTLTIPANGFSRGDAFQATFSGEISAQNNKTLEITIKAGSILLADTGVITMPGITNKNWRMDIDFSINQIGGAGVASIATAGTVTFRTDSSGDVVTEIFSTINNTTFDTTVNNTLVVTATWGNSPSDLSSIYSQLFTLLKVY
jgi:hypothetical protein